MAYSNPNFFGRAAGFPYEQQFVPWHQQAGQLLNFNPLINPLLPPFPQKQFASPLLFQQNNYYTSPSLPPALPFPHAFPPSARPPLAPHAPALAPAHSRPHLPPAPRTARTTEIIEISDDEAPPRPAVKAVIREKSVIDLRGVPQSHRHAEMKKNEKQIIAKKVEDIGLQDEEETKRITRVGKRIGKQTYLREDPKPKKKRIVKEKFVYKLSREEKALMELSRYRELRPQTIMVGPQFQAKIPPCKWFAPSTSPVQGDWLGALREKLLQRYQ